MSNSQRKSHPGANGKPREPDDARLEEPAGSRSDVESTHDADNTHDVERENPGPDPGQPDVERELPQDD
ncbi:MAG TPA: hypothetical protein VF267_04650 [Gammaproteobacteria bacterium]